MGPLHPTSPPSPPAADLAQPNRAPSSRSRSKCKCPSSPSPLDKWQSRPPLRPSTLPQLPILCSNRSGRSTLQWKRSRYPLAKGRPAQ
eukprot:4198401-Ditylum_brightwellii.AAC.1